MYMVLSDLKVYLRSFYYPALVYGKIRSYVQGYISTEFNTHEIMPNIFLGDIASAYNKGELEKHGITHVITAILGVDPVFPDAFIGSGEGVHALERPGAAEGAVHRHRDARENDPEAAYGLVW